MSGLIVRPLPGSGVLARFGDVVLACVVTGAEELVEIAAEVYDNDGDARELSRRLMRWALDNDAGPSCAMAGKTSDGRVAFLAYGSASIVGTVDGAAFAVTGTDSDHPVTRLVTGAVGTVQLRLAGSATSNPLLRLDSGVVSASGAEITGFGGQFAIDRAVDRFALSGYHTEPMDPADLLDPATDSLDAAPVPDLSGIVPEASPLPRRVPAAASDGEPLRYGALIPQPMSGHPAAASVPAPVVAALVVASQPVPPPVVAEPVVSAPVAAAVAAPVADSPPAGAAGSPARGGLAAVLRERTRHQPPVPAPVPPAGSALRYPDRDAAYQAVLLVEGSVPRDEAPPAPQATPAVMVEGVACVRDHLNPPGAQRCLVCSGDIPPGAMPRTGPRPALGILVLDNSMTFVLDIDYVAGREPQIDRDVAAGHARPLLVTDPDGIVSRRHARVRLDGWQVTLVDLGSANGTQIHRPGRQHPETVARGGSVAIEPGTEINLGSRRLRFEAHSLVHIGT